MYMYEVVGRVGAELWLERAWRSRLGLFPAGSCLQCLSLFSIRFLAPAFTLSGVLHVCVEVLKALCVSDNFGISA